MVNQVYVYGYFDKHGECVYIGIATTTVEQRHNVHISIKSNPKKEQKIDRWLKDNKGWTLVTLGTIELDNDIDKDTLKKVVHATEGVLVEEYEPKLNKYLKGGTNG